ncbi:MAG: hypothetical protein P0Y62_09920 [Candidatus Chryseobacterium colombiense]|nr:hypothetical protein [Chryseobacterium sp.]WEK68190.1 MAG: hypothetical protein P0Y62_09920 [Chryseobacterium sp.]
MNFFSKKTIAVILCVGIFSNFTDDKTSSQNTTIEIYSLTENINLKKWKNTEFQYHLVFGLTNHNEINEEFIPKLKKAGYKISHISDQKSSAIDSFLASKKMATINTKLDAKKFLETLLFLNIKMK